MVKNVNLVPKNNKNRQEMSKFNRKNRGCYYQTPWKIVQNVKTRMTNMVLTIVATNHDQNIAMVATNPTTMVATKIQKQENESQDPF